MAARARSKWVFINCPFDPAYQPLFRAIVFAIHDCGFIARSALEVSDSGEVRIQKILRIIDECVLGIHDISRTELDVTTNLPRFNMPLELGLFLGAKHFGDARNKKKACLILDRDLRRYEKFISDIKGQDIHRHENDAGKAIEVVRDWLDGKTKGETILPGGLVIAQRYAVFVRELPTICSSLKLKAAELTFKNYVQVVFRWLTRNPR
jgi:hypothetical protein